MAKLPVICDRHDKPMVRSALRFAWICEEAGCTSTLDDVRYYEITRDPPIVGDTIHPNATEVRVT